MMKARIKVEKIISSSKGTLIIFYTPGRCWEYAFIDKNSLIIHLAPGIVYTKERAEKDGLIFMNQY